VARAQRFGSHFVAAGGTAIAPALTEALRTRPASRRAARMVVFLTDGMPTVGQTDPGTITRNVSTLSAGARLFVFGVGDDVNTTFLDGLADANGGVGDYFRDGSELQRRMTAFFDRVSYPVFTDLRLTMRARSRSTCIRATSVISIAASSCSSWAGIAATGPGVSCSRADSAARPPHVR